MLGLTVEDFDDEDTCEVWPDHVNVVNLFIAMATQWRMGPRGPIGLDYNCLSELWKLLKIPKAERPEAFESLRVLEDAALVEIRKNIDGN